MTLSPAGGLSFGTYLGGTDDDYAQGLAAHGNGVISVAGMTEWGNFPVRANALQPNSRPLTEGFLARIALGGSPPPHQPGRISSCRP